MGLTFDPPTKGEPSYEEFQRERTAIYEDLKRRAHLATDRLNKMPGIRCPPIRCGVFAYPSIDLPRRFIQHALDRSMEPDALFCVTLLEQTGVATLPGSSLGQPRHTYHFRISLFGSEQRFLKALACIATFNARLRAEFRR